MITVTLGNSKLGRLAIEALLRTEPAATLIAGARDPAKVADLAARGVVVRKLDYDDPATLPAALAGTDKLVLISGAEVGKRFKQHEAVIAAAVKAGVKLLVYTSLLHAPTSGITLAAEHRATEDAVRASGLPFVILRNGWYAENYTGDLSAALQHGVVNGAAGAGRISAAARADYAEAIAAAATGRAEIGRSYELGADASFTLAELAAEIASQSGKPVAYNHLTEESYAALLASFGLPQPLAAAIASWDSEIAKGALEDNSGELSRLIGRSTASLSDAVAAGLRR